MYGVHECICICIYMLHAARTITSPPQIFSSTKPLPARFASSPIQEDIFGVRQVNDDCCIHR
jgi:hypothetical protein